METLKGLLALFIDAMIALYELGDKNGKNANSNEVQQR